MVCLLAEQVEKLWKLLCPLLRTALSNITVETYNDWGTCIATSCVSSASALLERCVGVTRLHRYVKKSFKTVDVFYQLQPRAVNMI